jgi:5-hydroxyisourate hydrolase-like protein (transthyretin family)
MNGGVIHIGSDTSFRDNYLLDMTPATSSWMDAALTVGQGFTDPDTGTSFTVLSADNSGASIRVETAAQACSRANPIVTVTPGQSNWMLPGSTLTYAVSVTNNNSGGCSNDQFNLSASVPGVLTGYFFSPSLSLPNGASGSVNVDISSSKTAADGTYSFGIAAVNSSSAAYAASGTASYTVVSRLTVAVAPQAPKYSRNQTAIVTATVSAGGSPVAGVAVTFTMTKANGSSVTRTATTASDGRATFSYRFNRKLDPVGTYSVTAASAFKGFTGQASTSFLVTK